MKYLSQASINYGKAIDTNPGEKYFREPQKRIETALSHYEKLEEDLKQRTIDRLKLHRQPSQHHHSDHTKIISRRCSLAFVLCFSCWQFP